jgi:hypothetical protein
MCQEKVIPELDEPATGIASLAILWSCEYDFGTF